ncbi:ATP-binding protein [Streptomyces sp900116325]|uniref:ATP-binding protein n=1 Tax=Streptomyces sp. 900116325 TaxID=3154295 RepID=UPI0033BB1250
MVNGIDGCMTRKPWKLPFLAEPEEVAGLRRVMRLHQRLWGLADVSEAAEICVSELAANAIRHVGEGTPCTLVAEMRDTRLRIGLRDPDTRALPTLIFVGPDAETGRGMALVDAVSERWGVILGGESKLVWCDLSTPLISSGGHIDDPRVTRSEACLTLYADGAATTEDLGVGRAGVAFKVEAAIGLIADLLHWLRAHGRDPDEVLDRAQSHFENEVGEVA